MLLEAGALSATDRSQLADWLKQKGKDPVDYAVETAAAHQVTIFGELHNVLENLLLLNRLIPELYNRAGVTCIAMEPIPAEDNALLARLVTAQTFDEDLAMRIARGADWECWGGKEYWDVLRTVWQLNRSLPTGSRKMRVIGIDFRWDAASLKLSGIGDYPQHSPPWHEKLRLFRAAPDIAAILTRDAILARNVEKEILEKGERGIVWIGAAHAPTHFRADTMRLTSKRDMRLGGKAVMTRMGYMLHQKYGDSVYHVRLHFSGGAIAHVIERATAAAGRMAVGFDLADSPFGRLRTEREDDYRTRPGMCFSDLADGYIILKPCKSLGRCNWQPGYISELMLGRNKSYYEYLARQSLKNADVANQIFASKGW
jgi:hypothetical protein